MEMASGSKILSAAFLTVTLTLSLGGLAQQHRIEIKTNDGGTIVIDAEHGLTGSTKDGLKVNTSVQEINQMCAKLDDEPWTDSDEQRGNAGVCEAFALVKPRIIVEKLSWERFFKRTYFISDSGFSPYKGMQLKTKDKVATYDSLLVPEGLGSLDYCYIENRGDTANPATVFKCFLKESSYAEAVKVERNLVADLRKIPVTEDESKEHGFLASDRVERRCTPTGICEHSHMFVTTILEGKFISVEAKPEFTRLPMPLELRLSGHEGMITGIAPDSGFVEISIFSSPQP